MPEDENLAEKARKAILRKVSPRGPRSALPTGSGLWPKRSPWPFHPASVTAKPGGPASPLPARGELVGRSCGPVGPCPAGVG